MSNAYTSHIYMIEHAIDQVNIDADPVNNLEGRLLAQRLTTAIFPKEETMGNIAG